MSNIAIKVENIGKQYRLGKVGTGTIAHDLNRWWHLLRGREDPYLKIGEENDRTSRGETEYVWALRNIDFEIRQGEAVGIIGRNGAGKSTLLKILSRTTAPSTGSLRLKGRVASLLEVGTGFHPELSGRENIYLNGAILGMSRREITRKFDEIVDFSGVERYVDTPVKRYSSGMYVRLAFAVAAHLESEILIVDEVLAVGDAEFQKKCLGKMGDVSRGEGRTILFVSHNMTAVKNLCKTGLMLHQGNIKYYGPSDEAIANYYASTRTSATTHSGIIKINGEHDTGKGMFTKVFIFDENEKIKNRFSFLENVYIHFEYESLQNMNDVIVSLTVKDQFGTPILLGTPGDFYGSLNLEAGRTRFSFVITESLMPGEYYVSLGLAHYISGNSINSNSDVTSFRVDSAVYDGKRVYPWNTVHGSIKPNSKIEIIAHEH